jgi:hypothetical protein
MNAIDLDALVGKAHHLWKCFARCFPSSVSEHELDELYDEWLIHCTLPFTPLTSVGRVLTRDDRAWLYQNWREERERERQERDEIRAEAAAQDAANKAMEDAAHKAALQAIGRDDLSGATDEQILAYEASLRSLIPDHWMFMV